MNAVETIAHHVSNLKFKDLPDLAVVRGRQIVLDTLGTALGGYQYRLGRLAADYVASRQPGNEATLIADGRRSNVAGAAWGNAVMAKFLGMDDSHRTGGHVAAHLVPVALALGEHYKLDGRRVLEALAAGYEVIGVIQPAVDTAQRKRGLDHKGQAGTMACAVTAALAMGLNQDQIANALALAMDMASGTEQYVYDGGLCDTKDLLSGYAARNGIYAANMAEFGFRGPPRALDGPYGYFHAFGDGYDPAYLDRLSGGEMLATTGFKPHAGCRYVHGCVDATQELLKAGRPALEDIVSIEIRTYKDAMTPDFRVNPNPVRVNEAAFSLPAAVSVTLARGSWYEEDIAAFDQPEIKRLWPLVSIVLDEAFEAAYPGKNSCSVEVVTRDGKHFTGEVEYAKGEPENMLTEAEFKEKFSRLASGLLSEERIDQILRTTSRLEDIDDVGDLVRLTAPSKD